MSVQSGLWASSSLYSRFGGHSSTCLTLPNSKYTLIAFLGAAQILSVDLLPITWNSALNDVGVGGTATLRERLISQNLSFLFKRVHPRHFQDYEARVAEDIAYRTLVAELETARNYEVVKSEFLAHLEGVSWDVEPNGEVWPVLVYEKAKYGSVGTAVESPHVLAPITLDLVTRLQICTHIAKGLATFHRNAIIHGDMKPDNVILFERPTGGLLAKITDFGFATSALSISGGDDPLHKGELHVRDDIVLTTPSYWSSATRHGEGYTFEAAVLEEVYSFGMTCFWILFYHLTTFPSDAEVEHAKSVGSMSELCLKLARDPELGATDDQIKTLEHLFVITLTHSKEDRATTLAIVDLLEPDVTPSNTIALRNFDVAPLPEGSTMRFIEFHLIAALTQLLAVDYRVRSYIRQSMERIVKEETRPEVLQRTHFELACCYHLGFGGLHDPEERDFHLMKADANLSEIEDELRKAMEIKGIVYFGGQFRTSLESGLVPPLDIVQSFRDVPSTSDLPELMKQEVESMERSLGPTSTHIIHMKANLANLLWEHREIQPARTMLRKCLESVDLNSKDVDPWDRVFLAGQVAEAEHRVGNWQEAEKLCHKALENAVQLGDEMTGEIIVLKNQLGLVFADLGRWDEASVIQREIVEYQREYLGANHPITLQMISSLVQTLIELGEYEEAEQHIQQISELRHSVWGPDSQDTLLSLMDEARFLEVQGRIEEAEALERQALSRCRRSLEEDHPYTLDCMMNLANSLINRDQTREAIELAEQCVAAYERVRGERHPDTLRSKTSLALVYNECGRYKDARALDRQVYDQLVHVLGHTHPFTLETMHNLATSHWKLGNPELAEELLLPTVNRRSLLLGEEHRETLQSKNMLAVVYAELDKLPDAIKIAEDILASSRKVLGSSHRETLITATNLASYYYDADDSNDWDLVVPYVLDYHLLLPDCPGHGRSSHIPFSIEASAEHIAHLIEAKANSGRAHVVGHSLGASIAVCLAANYPHVVHSLFISGYSPNPVSSAPLLPYLLWASNHMENAIPRPFVRWLMDGTDLRHTSSASLSLCRQIAHTGNAKSQLQPWSARTLIIVAGKGGLIPSNDSIEAARQLARVGNENNTRTLACKHPFMRHPWNRQNPSLWVTTVMAWVEERDLPAGFVPL